MRRITLSLRKIFLLKTDTPYLGEKMRRIELIKRVVFLKLNAIRRIWEIRCAVSFDLAQYNDSRTENTKKLKQIKTHNENKTHKNKRKQLTHNTTNMQNSTMMQLI